nr:unnamed protein product [Haemonchus contortus]
MVLPIHHCTIRSGIRDRHHRENRMRSASNQIHSNKRHPLQPIESTVAYPVSRRSKHGSRIGFIVYEAVSKGFIVFDATLRQLPGT